MRKAKYQATDDDDTDYNFGGMGTEEEDEEILNEIYEEMEVANMALSMKLWTQDAPLIYSNMKAFPAAPRLMIPHHRPW